MSLQVIVPPDHGAVDVLAVAAERVEVTPHDYPEDTYPNVWYYFAVRNPGPRRVAPACIRLSGLTAGPEPERVYVPFWAMSLWSRDGSTWERVPAACQEVGPDWVEFQADLGPGEQVWIAETFPLPWADCLAFMEALPEVAEPGFALERLDLGQSVQGRPILAARVSGGGRRPALVMVGGQHAVEESGKLCCMAVLEWLWRQRASPAVREVLARYEICVAPEVNPDGCYHGRMNTNAAGVVMDSLQDDSPEMQAQLGLVEALRPRIIVNCHGWGNTIGRPPFDGWYRWQGDDPLYQHVVARVPGAATSSDHFMEGLFRLETHARERFGTLSGVLEINWNFCVRPDGRVAQPTQQDLRARSLEYFRAIASLEV